MRDGGGIGKFSCPIGAFVVIVAVVEVATEEVLIALERARAVDADEGDSDVYMAVVTAP